MTIDDNFDQERLFFLFSEMGRAGTESAKSELARAFLNMAQFHNLPPIDYLSKLERDPSWRLKLWDQVILKREDSFFRYPETFEVAGELISEWGVLAPTKKLTAVILGAGRGFTAASLAVEIARQGFLIKAWETEIHTFELSPLAVKAAKTNAFSKEDIIHLDEGLLRRYLSLTRGEYHLKDGIKKLIHCSVGDPLAKDQDNSLSDFQGKADILLARGFYRDLPDHKIDEFSSCVESLLSEGGLAFLAPGEVFVPGGKLSLEERRGVFYFRRGESKRRANNFFSPKKMKNQKGVEKSPPPSPRLDQIRKSALMTLPTNPKAAKDFALEAITSAQSESGSFSPLDYKVLAQAEEALGRPEIAKRILELVNLFTKENKA
ncbi:MAG: hypothetical protein LBE27_01760 [Deltaproteobacteria bacterium]|jgi:chemotaxis methyl-accepting protein methylase|nr:hypothetical protein [Deltaproteobacteria bacterium]